MKKNKKQKIIIVITLVVLVLSAVGVYFYRFEGATSLIRQCPDSWWQNDMPSVSMPGEPMPTDIQRQHFVINGEEKDVTKYDTEWVKSRCSVKLEYSY